MKNIYSLLLAVLFLSSCQLTSRHDLENATPPQAETPAPEAPAATPPSSVKVRALKKNILDQDMKKNQDDHDLKKRVVVLPFLDNKGIHDPAVLKEARDAFMDSLNQSEELIAIDSGVLKMDLNKYIKNNMYDLKAIAKEAQTAGVSSLLEGRIIDMRFQNEDSSKVDNSSSLKLRKVAFEVVVQARLYNIRSEQELFNTVKTVTLEDEDSKIPENITSENFFRRNQELSALVIKEAFMDFNPKLIESLKFIVWEGRIAALEGERIYLNVGQISGVQVGDILKVVDDSNEIYDTELGYHLGKVPGKVKGTLEIVGFFGQDGAISVIHSGAGFKENDRVELYQ